ncbi:MAG: hypothetical protein ACT4QG_08980 [Sporichthyaceae bacterium]
MARKNTWRSGTGKGDRKLSGLTAAQSQRVRDLARRTLAARGLEATVYADHLTLIDGRRFGLENLASQCHNSDEGIWDTVVEAHLDAILAFCPEVPPDLTVDQIVEGAHLRLVPLDAVTGMGDNARAEAYRYARDIGGGFLEMLVYRKDGFVRWLRDLEVDQVGVEELRALGRERLLAIRPDVCEEMYGPNGRIYSIRGESGFVASKLLVLEQILEAALPRRDHDVPYGALVAVPTRHELLYTPVARDVIGTLAGMMQLAPQLNLDGRSPVSPHVYWWRADRPLDALTRYDAFGYYDLKAGEEFMEVLATLVPEFGAA